MVHINYYSCHYIYIIWMQLEYMFCTQYMGIHLVGLDSSSHTYLWFHLSMPKYAHQGLPWWLRWQSILLTMWETWVQSLGQEDPLEKEMATHSSTLACKIPWTEEHGGLQSMGSQRVGHDWATSLSLSCPKDFHRLSHLSGPILRVIWFATICLLI